MVNATTKNRQIRLIRSILGVILEISVDHIAFANKNTWLKTQKDA